MGKLQRDEIIFLLGAGASKDAGIPITWDMIKDIEKMMEDKWVMYKPIYDYLKASNDNLNIEDLVGLLDELLSFLDGKHPLSTFFKSWLDFMVSVSFDNKIIREFRKAIVEKLKEWIIPDNYYDAAYFQKLVTFYHEYQNPLRIFTLNYDLIIENQCQGQFNNNIIRSEGENLSIESIKIERGFGDETKKSEWD